MRKLHANTLSAFLLPAAICGALSCAALTRHRESAGDAASQSLACPGGPAPAAAASTAGRTSAGPAPERVIERARASVCLIEGSYVFRDKHSGRLLRRADWILDGADEVLEESFAGTGFLISPDGKVLTNRHIAQPWSEDEKTQTIVSRGYRPELTRLVAYFPGSPTRYALKPVRISEKADLALLQTRQVRDLPSALPLGAGAVLPGNQVLLIGYPSGLGAILARSGQARLDSIPGHENFTEQQVSHVLAKWNLIEPFVTVGYVSNVGADVLTLSAPISAGSSGSAVLDQQGRVIAIACATLTHVTGGSLAVPASFAFDLVGQPR